MKYAVIVAGAIGLAVGITATVTLAPRLEPIEPSSECPPDDEPRTKEAVGKTTQQAEQERRAPNVGLISARAYADGGGAVFLGPVGPGIRYDGPPVVRERAGDGFDWYEATRPVANSSVPPHAAGLLGKRVRGMSVRGHSCDGVITGFEALFRLSDAFAELDELDDDAAAMRIFTLSPKIFLTGTYEEGCADGIAILGGPAQAIFWHWKSDSVELTGTTPHDLLSNAIRTLSVSPELQQDYEQRKRQAITRDLPEKWYEQKLEDYSTTTLLSPTGPRLVVSNEIRGKGAMRYNVIAIWQVVGGKEEQPPSLIELGSVVNPDLANDLVPRAVAAVGSHNEPPTILFKSAIGYHLLRPTYALDPRSEVDFMGGEGLEGKMDPKRVKRR